MSLQVWHFISRFGEMQILLPSALISISMLLQKKTTRSLSLGWLVSLTLVTVLTTVSKIAFIGWGIGIPEIDFTGISGHTMLASAIYPLLLAILATHLVIQYQKFAVATGFLIAFLVGQSRLEIDVHSFSEVLAGALLGSAVSITMLLKHHLPRGTFGMRSWLNVLIYCGFFSVSMLYTPLIKPHSWVTQLSLQLSGSPEPYTRENLKNYKSLRCKINCDHV